MPIQRPTVYALISIACPFMFALGIKIYQQSGQVWNMSGNTESDHAAGALLAFSNVVQFVFVMLIGCVLGLIFGAVSLIKKKRIVSIGLVGLILNSLPFVALLILLLSKGV
jgi:hypothetical protein